MNGPISKESKCCGCVCGPYPQIDLTAAFVELPESSSADACSQHHQDLEYIKAEVMDACSKFGCFHILIKQSAIAGGEILSNEKAAKNAIEMLFDETFLSTQCTSANTITSVPFLSVDGYVHRANYRGRAAESGGTSGLEPKQSWECFRCRNLPPSAPSKSDTKAEASKDENDPLDQLNVLNDFTRTFHKVASSLFLDILGFPRGYFIDETECTCDTETNAKSFCSIDLLRAFKYDALADGREINLGSSPHTDWGSLTVVWQDSKGGLQIYCHEHERWNNVDVPTVDGNKFLKLFIHVGDFTSLTKCGSASTPPKEIIWPSPLHRVLCPKQGGDAKDCTEVDEARYSLVYFIYPPRGISLEDARSSLPQRQPDIHSTRSFPYERYMVLKDQSFGATINSMTEEEVYNDIARISFDSVIKTKWNQVQRTEN
jgi:hypothetical protein